MWLKAGILVGETISVYLIVLSTHALRHRFGPALFNAFLGGITAIMSLVTDAGVTVRTVGITFMIGSTVFYTSLLLGVFVVYVFDSPGPTDLRGWPFPLLPSFPHSPR